MWLEALRTEGAEALLTDAGENLTVCRGGAAVSWRLRRLKRPPRPSEVGPLPTDQALWLPRVSRALRERLDRLDIAWVSDSGDLRLPTPWGTITYDASHHPHAGAGSGETQLPDRRSRGTLAVLQFLLEHPHTSNQTRIAEAVLLSQPRVSQILATLREEELVNRTGGGWTVPEPDRALDAWLSAAIEPAALTTAWYSLAPAREQIASILTRAKAERAAIRLCGDWAADVLAPWRQPALIAIHIDRTLDLEGEGFVPAPAQAATGVLHVGPIPTAWLPDPTVVAAMTSAELRCPVAPITEIVREIRASGGSDAADAAGELTSTWLRARAAVVSGRTA